ncbi:hypothetical protein CCACVL1_17617 [Corchorus capsularis]|uniref:Replication protein A 70 kDa DNA-binding subunit B/D first OB fold domain-containing protein n=1 Tax=Corchorus capsularis TaxID=210143 RepID=A0A1R3HR35_COCAP|nr:hypothetical protein CCACVL1_17617 [Corchorus capsularis]
MALAIPDKKPLQIIHARLSDLRPGLMAYVITRVARKWETVLPGGTIPINGDLLLVDDRGGSIEVVIPHDCMRRFSSDKVVKGKVYKILHFEVLDRKKKYKSIPAEFTIYFNSSTKLIELTEGINMYPMYFFRFADMIEIRERSKKDPVFTDVIGMFVGYGEPIAISVDSGTRMSDKLDVNLRLLRSFIIVFCLLYSSLYVETKFISSSSTTKVYVNPDILEAEEIRQRFKNDLAPVQLLAPEHTS